MPSDGHDRPALRIEVEQDGPYVVHGATSLVLKSPVVSEHGEPLTWKTDGRLDAPNPCRLCRCGMSGSKPFCDDTHQDAGFDGAEQADTNTAAERQITYEHTVGMEIKRDHGVCMDAGFCGTRLEGIVALAAKTGDSQMRARVMAMIERCPSGSLSYSLAPGLPANEPDYPAQVTVTTEMTSDGPIIGPLWVTGSVPITRADGKPFEARPRVTLCRCGRSEHKPLCDGAHRELQIRE